MHCLQLLPSALSRPPAGGICSRSSSGLGVPPAVRNKEKTAAPRAKEKQTQGFYDLAAGRRCPSTGSHVLDPPSPTPTLVTAYGTSIPWDGNSQCVGSDLVEHCTSTGLPRHLCVLLRSGPCSTSLRDLVLQSVADVTDVSGLCTGSQPTDSSLAQALVHQVLIFTLQWAARDDTVEDAVQLQQAMASCVAVCANCPSSGMSHVRPAVQRAMRRPLFKHYSKQGELCVELREALASFPLYGARISVVPIPGGSTGH